MADDRSPAAKAMAMVSQITSIALMGVAPALIGFGLDTWWGSKPIVTLIGGLFGAVAATYQLSQLVARLNARDDSGSVD